MTGTVGKRETDDRDSGEQKGQTDDQGQWGRERQMTGTTAKRGSDI